MSETLSHQTVRTNPAGQVSILPVRVWRYLAASLVDKEHLQRQMSDYAEVGKRLFWQRQMTFSVALILAAYYYSWRLALLNLVFVAICEIYDYRVFQSISRVSRLGQRLTRGHFWSIVFGTLISSASICFFVIWIAVLQGQESHFMPLFFLFAAGVFAAMNNHHMLSILALRLLIYGVTFLTIPIRDIVITGASINSEPWVQLFSSMFVAFFIVDCSRIFLEMYRNNLERLSELESKNAKIQAALAAKSAFLSTMSHELRTPLTSISASLDLALSDKIGQVDEKPKQVLSIAQRNARTLKTLIDEVLDLQKASAGKFQLDRKEADLVTVLQDAVEVNRPFAESCGCTIDFVPPETPVPVFVDAARVKQVITNLLSNAAKFSPAGSTVDLRLKREGDIALIEVCDAGDGLDESHKTKVFEPFVQLDSSDTRKAGGTGLGLSIAKEIVESHDGRINYRRNSGKGTTFWVTIPIDSHPSRAPAA